ncbi:MAG: DUF1592 domain-containing protein [Myxococcales bacterium]|nr:DUF1592 domain-containing protein [Myxococcales bacterium]
MRRHGALLALTMAMAGCIGAIGGGDDEGSPPGGAGVGPQGIACDPDAAISATPMRRLGHTQYLNALRALGEAFLGEETDAALEAIALKLELVPEEDSSDYRALDQDLSQLHVDGYYAAARGFAAELTDGARLERVVGSCASDGDPGNDEACVRDFVARFGRLAFRRPLREEELDFYAEDALLSVSDVAPGPFAERIAVLLMAPDFVYVVEDDREAEDGDADLFPLSGYELASRLALLFWRSIPDEALLAAAEDGSLETDEGYRAAVDRLLADPRAERGVDQFVAEWLRLEELPALDAAAGSPAYEAFVAGVTPSAALREAMIAEIQALFRHYALSSPGSLDDLLTSDLSFATDEQLAAIYGVEPWTPGQPPGALKDRAGLLTRAALVASGTPVTHPILKGKLVRTRILCDDLPPPPADVPPPPALDPTWTVREQLEELTERSGTPCVACHASLNPIGYVTESFDGLGRHRATEKVYDLQTGELVAEHPVNTSAAPLVTPDDTRVAEDGLALARYVAESGKADACIARHYFRYSRGRLEDETADGCTLESLYDAVAKDGGSLGDLLRAIALDPAFKLRRRRGDTP